MSPRFLLDAQKGLFYYPNSLRQPARRNGILESTLEKIELDGILEILTAAMGGGAHGILVQESDF